MATSDDGRFKLAVPIEYRGRPEKVKPLVLTVMGTIVMAHLEVAQERIDFGAVTLGTTVWRPVTLVNHSLCAATLVLDRVQDAGNVGSMLRSASAFGFGQVIALRETAALWSPKVLRAGMGAHFALSLHEGADLDSLQALAVPLLVTSSHAGNFIQDCRLPFPCAWAMGHEGQGVQPALMALAAQQVRIGQPGGEESLNVAAAAAICLHASALEGAAR
jgi:tRNA G18 (ribose-2'-O)-methylase SpoU